MGDSICLTEGLKHRVVFLNTLTLGDSQRQEKGKERKEEKKGEKKEKDER